MKKTKIIAAFGVVAALGVAGLPLASYAVDSSSDITLSVNVGNGIAMEVAGAESVHTISALTAGQKDESMKTVVKVSTNDVNGYTLSIKDKDNDTNLTDADGNVIPASNSIVEGVAGWGYKVDGDYKAITSEDAEIKATSTAANNDTTVINYGVSTAVTTHAGEYSDVLVVTAQANS